MRQKTVIYLLLLFAPLANAQVEAPKILRWGEKAEGNRWTLGMNLRYEQSDSKLTSQTTELYDANHVLEQSLETSEEEIKEDNNQYERYNNEVIGEFKVGYRVWNNLHIWGALGFSQMQSNNELKEEEFILRSATARQIVPTVSLGVSYSHLLTDRLFVQVDASMRYTHADEMLYQDYYESDGMIEDHLINFDHSSLMIYVPVTVGYQWGRFVPSVGVAYRDVLTEETHSFNKTYIGDEMMMVIKDIQHSVNKVRGVANLDFYLAKNVALGAHVNVGKSTSGSLSLIVKL